MVAGRQNKAPISGTLRDVQCVNIKEALESGMPGTLLLYRAKIDSKQEIEAANIPMGIQLFSVIDQGCTGNKVGYTQEEKVVVACPAEKAQRCAGCILDVVKNGEAIQRSLIEDTNPRSIF